MKGRQLLDAFVELGLATCNEGEMEAGDTAYWLSAYKGVFNELNIEDISKELMLFLECDSIGIYLKVEDDEDDADQIRIYYKPMKKEG